MLRSVVILNALFLLASASSKCVEKETSGHNTDMKEALQFLEENDKESEKVNNKFTIANWNYESDLTDENEEEYMRMTNALSEFGKETYKNASSFAWKTFKNKENKNETAYKMFEAITFLGTSALSNEKFNKLTNLIDDMQDLYAKAKVCSYKDHHNCTLSIEPEITEIMKESRDYNELKYYWTQWRDKTGRKMKTNYTDYLNLSNEAACLNGYSDNGELWLDEFESDNIIEELESLWEEIKPLYQQLHAYVRRKLIQKYPGHIKENGPIPAHLLGEMWGETWTNIYDLVAPYPHKGTVDVTAAMRKKKMTPLDMFKIAEEFFVSLGLKKMTPEFWNRSIIVKPTDRELVCHASAWDFFDKKDFRIKMCTTVNMEDFVTIHHEMGHIQYFMQYKDQPVCFRDGANSGFHEAIGDVMALSVSTSGHMVKIGLLDKASNDTETEINELMTMALDKIAFVPFGFLVDAWRWKVFDGSIKKGELNKGWWDMRLKYQGLCPPVRRTERDLDAGSKFHVAADVPYIRYFVSYVIQFQFHKALCDEAGYTGPLHKCDIYQNKKAGTLLSDMLKLGSSVSWRKAMRVITKEKTDKMEASAILDYFKPLHDWLVKQNSNGRKVEHIGWESDNSMMCP